MVWPHKALRGAKGCAALCLRHRKRRTYAAMRRTGWTGLAGRARTAAFSRKGLRGGARPHSKIRKGVLKMRLSQNIAGLRHAAGWSQEELAARLDVTRQSVSKWESGGSLR